MAGVSHGRRSLVEKTQCMRQELNECMVLSSLAGLDWFVCAVHPALKRWAIFISPSARGFNSKTGLRGSRERKKAGHYSGLFNTTHENNVGHQHEHVTTPPFFRLSPILVTQGDRIIYFPNAQKTLIKSIQPTSNGNQPS